ncbi:MAG: hypothetical protein FWC40_04725, partial [Proteobacteria bacterium]|nr:hypothetical protein [Pseudomonadota bacterium]
SGDELGGLFRDLGMHYRLDPSKLSSFFEAGFDTGGGFGVGWRQDGVFFVFETRDDEAFLRWWDNLANEEFGRPRHHRREHDGWTITQVRVLKEDLASVATSPGRPAIVVLGSKLVPGSGESEEALVRMLSASKKLSEDAELAALKTQFGGAPMVAYIQSPSRWLAHLGDEAGVLSSGGIRFVFGEASLKVEAVGHWEGEKYVVMSKGALGEWADPLMGLGASSQGRVLFNAVAIETFVLPMLGEGTRRAWESTKGKLEQRILGISLERQILDNFLGLAWFGLYGVEPVADGAMDMKALLDQPAALFLPFRDVDLAQSFFSKLNVLKGVLPKDRVSLELEEGTLHGVVRLSGNLTLHVAYRAGLLVVMSGRAWPMVRDFLQNPGGKGAQGLLGASDDVVSINVSMVDVVTLLGARYTIVREQASKFLAPVRTVGFRVQMNPSFLSVVLEFDLASKEVH